MSPFSVPLRLRANPYLYDYVHGLHFLDGGEIKMFAAAGQEFISMSRGRFALQIVNESEAIVSLSDLCEVDSKNEKLRDICESQVSILAESGTFIFPRPISRSHSEAEWPFEVYKTRYVFSVDPLAYARQHAMGTVFYQLVMTPERIDSERYYYPADRGERASAADVEAMGIAQMPT